jgi:hypothetical protein
MIFGVFAAIQCKVDVDFQILDCESACNCHSCVDCSHCSNECGVSLGRSSILTLFLFYNIQGVCCSSICMSCVEYVVHSSQRRCLMVC